MIFHFGFELPVPESPVLNHEVPNLTQEEIRIIKQQIRRNRILVDQEIGRLELLVNQERYPRDAVFLKKIRKSLGILMEENDTFRQVLWKHYQKEEALRNPYRNRL